MTSAFKVGDRVRLTQTCRHPDYRPSDPGTVEQLESVGGARGLPLYHVRMDKDGRAPTFYADELELPP